MAGTKCDTAHTDFSTRYQFTTLTEKQSELEDFTTFNFSINPNPSNGQVSLSSNENSSSFIIIKIFDLTGKVVYTDEWANGGSATKSLDLTKLQSGVYSIQLLCNNREAIRKLVLMK